MFEQYPYLDGLFKMASQRGVDVCQLTSSHCCGAAVKGLNTLRREIDATLSTIELARLDEAIYARMDLTGRIYDECKLAVLAENPGFGAPAPNPQNQEMSACASSDLGSVELCECKTPAEEAETVGMRIASAVQAGVKVEDIVLVVPNRVWARSMGKALSKQGIQSVETFEPHAFKETMK